MSDSAQSLIRAEEGRALLRSAISLLENCTVQSGVCCCGENMQDHTEPMFCGHSPVDLGEWQAHLWVEQAKAFLGDEA